MVKVAEIGESEVDAADCLPYVAIYARPKDEPYGP